jgi:hypothetical protein
MAFRARPLGLPDVPPPSIRDRGHDLRRRPQAEAVVPRGLDVTSQKYGASALGLKRTLGLGSYETAWAWLHKLRRAMVRPDRDQLAGEIEVDETYVGGTEPGLGGRRTIKKAIVIVLVEMNEGKIGRIRFRQVPNVTAASIQGVIAAVVKVAASCTPTVGRATPSSRTGASDIGSPSTERPRSQPTSRSPASTESRPCSSDGSLERIRGPSAEHTSTTSSTSSRSGSTDARRRRAGCCSSD